MLSFNLLLAGCPAYAALLFAMAFVADRRERRGRLGWLRRPWADTLSPSIYCPAWTFWGAVGWAARSRLSPSISGRPW